MNLTSNAPKIVLLPGLNNSGPNHWQTLWEKEFHFDRITMCNWTTPTKEHWSNCISSYLTETSVIVAHSLGCHAVAEWAASTLDTSFVLAALLVAPPDLERSDTPNEIKNFLPMQTKRLPFPSTLVASRNDPYATFDRTSELATNWGSTFVDVGNLGHINADSKIGAWPDGLLLLTNLLDKAQSDRA